ncbi:MAG: hypothetical protein GY823_06750 [Flavobacteriaceae bacterium]|nr:hypothetical protein [Flavobacteriaceae bacterium]|tara:strand:- start:1252 stop:1947 length:696 start_codon:yes stop_codon:yes gene_type:complete
MEKYIPLKFNPTISIFLWVVILFLGYSLYKSIIGPVEFNKVKQVRYAKVIENLKDIRISELAHQEIEGKFSGNFDSLVQFLDTAKFAIIQRRDTSYADVEKNRAFGLDAQKGGYYKEEIIVDTLRFASVKDSLFGDSDRYKTMMNIPLEIAEGAKFQLKAGKYEKNDALYSVFEASVAKRLILSDQDTDLIYQEEQLVSVDGINGPTVRVGTMNDIDTGGNWPKLYDSPKQ